MPDFSPVDYAVPGFVLLVLAEMLWAWKRRPEAYEARDTLTSLAFGLGSTVAGVLLGGFALLVFLAVYEYRLFDIGWVWWAWPVCFVLDDLAYYWIHRAIHASSLLWRVSGHGFHHAYQNLHALNSGATHPLEVLFLALPALLITALSVTVTKALSEYSTTTVEPLATGPAWVKLIRPRA